ncbi:MAG: hypothetical protein E6G47_12245 [Actinobacteria bacterium]|nr:MAG: hypothetical protein E6G47_12245 [Actinomycetota bacterium]
MRPGNQRGIVVVLALLVLAILAVLMAATLRLATSEVTLANNQHDHSQARALAESGLEFALAQLNGGGNPRVTNQPMDVNGLAIGSFSTVLTWASPTNVLVVATSMTTGPRPARSTCRVRLHQDPVTTTKARLGRLLHHRVCSAIPHLLASPDCGGAGSQNGLLRVTSLSRSKNCWA